MIKRLVLWSTVDRDTTSKKYFWSNFHAVQRAQLGLWKVCGPVCTYQLVPDTKRPAPEGSQTLSLPKTAWQHLYNIVSLRKLLTWCVFNSPPMQTSSEGCDSIAHCTDSLTQSNYCLLESLRKIFSEGLFPCIVIFTLTSWTIWTVYGILTFWTNQFKF